MDKLFRWIKNRLPTQRRLIQLYSALLYNAHLKGFINGDIYTGNAKMLCVPGFNCYSCPGATGACPLGALQNAIASSGHRAPTYVLGVIMLYGLILGRTICGFLCPIGLLQELLHKIPTPKLKKNRLTRALSYGKYLILVLFVIILPLISSFEQLPLPAFCKYICPAGTFEGAIGLLSNPVNADKFSMLGILFTRKYVIMLAIGVLCVFIYRGFCRFFCPLGAIYGLFSQIAIIGIKVDMPKCIGCDRCVKHCKMDVSHVGDHECIHCGACIDVCPTAAISYKAGKYTLHGPQFFHVTDEAKKKSRNLRWIGWTLALLILGAVIMWVNRPETRNIPVNATIEESTADTISSGEKNGSIPAGKDVGMYAPNFSVPVYGQERLFTLSEHLGKKVVINFWATWCMPCCKELPYFDQIHRKYGEDVIVIAIHSDLVTDDVEDYLLNYDYLMSFALDTTGDVISSFGGALMLPQTVIVDEDGIIVYNAVGSLSLEKLEALLRDSRD